VVLADFREPAAFRTRGCGPLVGGHLVVDRGSQGNVEVCFGIIAFHSINS